MSLSSASILLFSSSLVTPCVLAPYWLAWSELSVKKCHKKRTPQAQWFVCSPSFSQHCKILERKESHKLQSSSCEMDSHSSLTRKISCSRFLGRGCLRTECCRLAHMCSIRFRSDELPGQSVQTFTSFSSMWPWLNGRLLRLASAQRLLSAEKHVFH